MDAYKIGVKLVMSSNFNEVTQLVSQALLGLNVKVDQLTGKFNSLGTAIKGAFGIFGGYELEKGLYSLTKYGEEIAKQQSLMRDAGMNANEITEATSKATQTASQIQTTTIAENLKHLRELRYAFGNMDDAQKALGILSKSNTVLQSTVGNEKADQIWDIVKSLEMKGLTTQDLPTFNKYVEAMTRAVEASGGKVDPRQFFMAFRYGRTAMQGWDLDFIGGALPRLIQSMGGAGGGGGGRAGPGNALMSAFGAVVQDTMTKRASGEFTALGMGDKDNGILGHDLFIKNPYEWVQQVLMPHLQSHGITSQEDIVSTVSHLFANRTAGQVITEMALQGRTRMGTDKSPFEKDIRLQQGALGAESGFANLMATNPEARMEAFTKQWNSMMEALGAPMVPLAIEMMKQFTDVFSAVGSFAMAHPTAFKIIGEGLAALGAAAVVAGLVTLGTLIGPVGLIAGAVTWLGAMAALHWGDLVDGLKGLVTWLGNLWDKIKNTFSWFIPSAHADTLKMPHFTTQDVMKALTGNTKQNTDATDDNTKAIKENTDMLRGMINYTGGGIGGGGGGGVIPASYTGGASLNDTAAPAGVKAALQSSGAAVTNSWIAGQRAGFARELQDPTFRSQFAAMLQLEGPTLGTAESAMNRALATGHSLHDMVTGSIGRRFYSTYGRFIHGSPSAASRYGSIIDKALAGSDTIKGFTDQGMPTDPNGPLNPRHPYLGPYVRQGGNIFNDWQRGRYRKFREDFEAHAHAGDSGASASIPNHPASQPVELHNIIHLDGRAVSKNIAKHFVRMGQGPAHGARLPDYGATRPIGI